MPVEAPGESKIYAVSEAVAGDSSPHVVTLTAAYVSRHAVLGKPDLVASVSGFSSAAGVYLRGRLTEQDLRLARYRHHEETPLDDTGEPLFWHQEYWENPHRR